MSSTFSVAALLVLLAVARAAPGVPHAVEPPPPLPEAVLAHPAAGTAPELQAELPRWSAQRLAAWPGPWESRPGELYDHRYITW
jgi:hypothetical protein